MKKFKIEVKRFFYLDEQTIVGMICDALGVGAINYWGSVAQKTTGYDYKNYKNQHPEYDCWDECMGHFLVDGGTLYIRDDEEGKTYGLTIDAFIEGIKKNSEDRPWDSSYDNYDATTIDSIIQYALFNDVVYG